MRNFEHTVNVLVQAYLNNTLVQGHPCGCGCGNIIAFNNGLKIESDGLEMAYWLGSGIGSGFDWYRFLHPDKIKQGNGENGAKQIASTGYTPNEFFKIEEAFEDVNKQTDGSYATPTEDSIFKGLMAVVDILADIHGIDLKQKEEAKLLFAK